MQMRNPLSAMIQCADLIATSLTGASTIISVLSNDAQSNRTAELKEHMDNSLDAVQTIVACAMHQKHIVDDVLTLS